MFMPNAARPYGANTAKKTGAPMLPPARPSILTSIVVAVVSYFTMVIFLVSVCPFTINW